MAEFFALLLTIPTVFFASLLVALLGYWGLVIAGALQIDLHADVPQLGTGTVDAAHPHGALESAVEGSALITLLSWLGLRDVPLTLWLSSFALTGFFVSVSTSYLLAGLPSVVVAFAATLAAVISGAGTSALTMRPIGKLLATRERSTGAGHIGKSVRITTEQATMTFGQAELDDGGAGLVLPVRTQNDVVIKLGQEAVIVAHNSNDGSYEIVPLEDGKADDGKPSG